MPRRQPSLVAFTGIAAALLGGCGPSAATAGERGAAPPGVPRPPSCREVPAGELAGSLAAAGPGEALCLPAGRHPGPIRVPAGVTLWGPREAVVTSGGRGTTVELEGDGARLLGLTVDGSGSRFDTLDAAVRARGREVAVEGVRVVHATFGILVERSREALIRGNHVTGDAASALGLRGDGIRLWETDDSTVEGNRVEDSRDVVVWYSRRNAVRDNEVVRGRYGTHFMFSHDNRVERNRYVGNEVGVFVMYSRGIELLDNLMADGTGAAGMGIGVKESGGLKVEGNQVLHDTVGLYLDTSPLQLDEHNLIARNVFRLCQQAVVFHSSERRNAFRGNAFQDNGEQVVVEGGGHALEVEWSENHFDDYAGYDLDRDGLGDVPYEVRDLSSDLVSRQPELAFFRGTPALALVRAAGEIVPVLAPRPILRDERPRMQPHPADGEVLGAR